MVVTRHGYAGTECCKYYIVYGIHGSPFMSTLDDDLWVMAISTCIWSANLTIFKQPYSTESCFPCHRLQLNYDNYLQVHQEAPLLRARRTDMKGLALMFLETGKITLKIGE